VDPKLEADARLCEDPKLGVDTKFGVNTKVWVGTKLGEGVAGVWEAGEEERAREAGTLLRVFFDLAGALVCLVGAGLRGGTAPPPACASKHFLDPWWRCRDFVQLKPSLLQ